MSIASTSRSALQMPLRRQLADTVLTPSILRQSNVFREATIATPRKLTTPEAPWRVRGAVGFSTSTRAVQAPSAGATATNSRSLNSQQGNSSRPEEESSSDGDPDEPPKKATIRERLRFLSRRYGWWALGVYLLASTLDFSLVFAAIHLLGADHIRELEDRFRNYIGMGKRELEDHEVAAWPVPVGSGVLGGGDDEESGKAVNNEAAARKAAHQVVQKGEKATSSSSSSSSSSTLWTEAVLAYTIHKTLLLPFRVGVTAAITPSFVKYMIKLGWAKDNAAVHQAAKSAKMARDAAKAKKS